MAEFTSETKQAILERWKEIIHERFPNLTKEQVVAILEKLFEVVKSEWEERT